MPSHFFKTHKLKPLDNRVNREVQGHISEIRKIWEISKNFENQYFETKNVDFFQKSILAKIVKNKGLRVIQEYILSFLKKKSKIIAKLSKIDLYKFERKSRKKPWIPEFF